LCTTKGLPSCVIDVYIWGVWFCFFLFSFSLKTENCDENVFGWISENIFSENENRKQSENENIQCFQLRTKILF